MLVHEFHIPLNMTVDEFQVAQLYMVVDASEKNTKGGEGVEILKNEPYDNREGQLGDISPISNCKIPRNRGQYTLKHYYCKSEIPGYISALCPEESMTLIEEAWNAYPHCLTVITNGYLAKKKFSISIESLHVPGLCDIANPLQLTKDELKGREVELIRIESDLPGQNSPDEYDPSVYKCPKTGRGPLQRGWTSNTSPIMTCVKVVRVNFDYWGFQGKVERFIRDRQRRLFHSSLRQAQCLSGQCPGWLVAISYMDRRALELAVTSGAYTNFDLVGVLLLSAGAGLFLQVLAIQLGAATGRSLAQHCANEYPRVISLALCCLQQIAIIGKDMEQLLGSAIALNFLLQMPLWAGCILTCLTTFLLLTLQNLSGRYFILFLGLLLMASSLCFLLDFSLEKTVWSDVAAGVFPMISSFNAREAVNTLSTLVIPHNLFLHSALVARHSHRRTSARIVKDSIVYFTIETGIALAVTVLVKIAVFGVFADSFYSPSCSQIPVQSACLSPATALYSDKPIYNYYAWAPCIVVNHEVGNECPRCQMGTTQEYGYCQQLELDGAGTAIQDVLGRTAANFWALGLLAAAQASAIASTFAGQLVMEDFVNFELPSWQRIGLFRALALIPALIFAEVFLTNPNENIRYGTWLNMLQGLLLPFALVPLFCFTSSRRIMGKSLVMNQQWRISGFILIAILCSMNYYLIGLKIDFAHWNSTEYGTLVVVGGLYVFVLVYIVVIAPWCIIWSKSKKEPEDLMDSLLIIEEESTE
ncbi:phosphatidylinositol transfer protein beta isoform [Thraustotheca clavata]|uniref:Phosphatidylinositol transfer protein beta isoform n=1 Tax=Thraustotheca clavata TaxID=74557 RepID=A0A1W0A453_9STRA|nr:phosphatidylinositol transfer protein beta isoform [Thraustotheca clavata]